MNKAEALQRAINTVIASGEFPQWKTPNAAPVVLNYDAMYSFVSKVLGAIDQELAKPKIVSSVQRCIDEVQKLLDKNLAAQKEYLASPVITSPSIGLMMAEGHLRSTIRQLERENAKRTRAPYLSVGISKF